MSAQQAPKHICIVGAGIAGLTLALALGKLGARVTVLERNENIQEFGAGLQISPNARHALSLLGLDEPLQKVAFEPDGIDVYPFRASKPLVNLTLGKKVRDAYGSAYAVMHRANLVQTLFLACKRFANIDIRFSVTDFDLNPRDDDVEVTYTIANKAPQTTTAAVFIGADGARSRTRTKYISGQIEKYSGYVAWRALLDLDALKPELSTQNTSLLWGPGFHAVIYPLPHRGTVNIALFSKEPRSIAFGTDTTPTLPAHAAEDPRFARILGLVKDWRQWPLNAVKTAVWYKGRVGICGDAAHAMLPFQAQGAAMAIESAVILAPLLLKHNDIEAAFKIYTKRRYERVTLVAKQSEQNGEIFHLKQPLAFARNIAVKARGPLGHLKRVDWIYDYKPGEDFPLTS